MAELEAYLHYRIIDVSSIKELARRWFPRAYFAAPTKNGGHRALADIRESIAELRYYREAVFVPPPGPRPNRPAASPRATSSTTRCQSVPPPPSAWSGAPPSNRYDGSRCGRTGILGCRAPVVVGVAQLVEHLVVVQGAAGSSPVTHPTVMSAGHRQGPNPQGSGLVVCRVPDDAASPGVRREQARSVRTRGLPGWRSRIVAEAGFAKMGACCPASPTVVTLVIVIAFVVVAVAPAFAATPASLAAARPARLVGPPRTAARWRRRRRSC